MKLVYQVELMNMDIRIKVSQLLNMRTKSGLKFYSTGFIYGIFLPLLCFFLPDNSYGSVKYYKDYSSAIVACHEEANKADPGAYTCFNNHGGWPQTYPYYFANLTCDSLDKETHRDGSVTWRPSHANSADCLSGSTPTQKIKKLFFFAYGAGACSTSHQLDPVTDECLAADQGKSEGGTCSVPGLAKGADAINPGVGNHFRHEVDFVGQGVFPLAVERNFNSTSGDWQFFSEVSYVPGETIVKLVRSDGKKLSFTSDGAGGWASDADIKGALVNFDDGAGNITAWRYTTTNDQIEDYDASGRITKITSLEGLSHTFTYTSNAITVTDNLASSLALSLDGEGFTTGFTDPDGNLSTYSYDEHGRLIGVNYPNGSGSRTYHYESLHYMNKLTGITDEKGNRLATWEYDIQGRVISSEHANGADKVAIDYTNLEDGIDPRTIAINALAKQTTYHYTTIHGVRKVTQVEGHQSTNCAAANQSYTYDANGFKDLVTDWEGNITDYDHDARGLEVQRIEAKGSPQQRVITTEWHPDFRLPTKITEPDRVIDFSYDAEGLLLERKESPVP